MYLLFFAKVISYVILISVKMNQSANFFNSLIINQIVLIVNPEFYLLVLFLILMEYHSSVSLIELLLKNRDNSTQV